MRTVIAALVVVALIVGILVVWPRDGDVEAESSTTSTSVAPTTLAQPSTTARPDSTTSSAGEAGHVVTTVEEAEAILRDLWFGWFDGIYLQDEDRIREVVGNDEIVSSGIDQFGSMKFASAPTASALRVKDTEILRSDAECLAVWAVVSGDFRRGSIQGVHVFRSEGGHWFLVNTWPLRNDLWEEDCEVLVP